ncbi:MAG: hypothetical protein SF028_10340 [Candidatus Sumerlaeia bacterium]|nr:hypothetical protein [Candidatus Sumerlaeia bacterium]
MARTILKDKTALVAGADNPAGRAAALQFARAGMRILLVGDDEQAVVRLADAIIKKDGEAAELPLARNEAELAAELRAARDAIGHVHVAVNCYAFSAGEGSPEWALAFQRVLEPLLAERSFTRHLLVMPHGADAPDTPEGVWRCVVQPGAPVAAEGSEGLRAGALADALVFLAQIPPSARPTRVLLDPFHGGDHGD